MHLFSRGSIGHALAILSWWSFVTALVSGVVLAFHYRPCGDVFSSLSKLTYQLPYGLFFRKLHYLSGQGFLVLATAHMGEQFLRETYRSMKPAQWTRLAAATLLSFPLVFTGFILKGDKAGIFAGEVMVHLSREIPLLGSGLAALLLKPGEDFFLRPYLHHCVILPLLVILLLGGHRKWFFRSSAWIWPFLAALVAGTIFYPLAADIPPRAAAAYVGGPWFFLGIQLLLRYGPALWVGVIWPLSAVLPVFVLPFSPASSQPWLRIWIGVVWGIHLAVVGLAGFLLPSLAGNS